MADGLGHGVEACRAATLAVESLDTRPADTAIRILDLAHGRLRATRGAAVAVMRDETATGEIAFAGVGNIAACIWEARSGSRRTMVSHNGIVGHNVARSQEYRYPWAAGALLIAHSDGLESQWDIGSYPGLAACHPSVIAAVLYREHSRATTSSYSWSAREGNAMSIRLLSYELHVQSDVVGARQRARQIAELLGFAERDQTRIATSVSEIARNAFRYAGGGKVEFELEGFTTPQILLIHVTDEGPGIGNLQEVLDGTYHSTTGMGIGLIGSRRLMDRWEIHSSERGTEVTIGKLLPDEAPLVTALAAGKLVSKLLALPNATSITEMQTQNAELLAALAELQEKQNKLRELAHELEDTNRGVVALYAELDEKAVHLRRADEIKTRFLSNMTHEFRTPLNSMRALCGMLLAKIDGTLSPEQEKQVSFIAKASDDLSELVNDLLDIAKIEAGKIEVRPVTFDVAELFSALRGMLRPLLVTDTVDLEFDEPAGIPDLLTDESKVSQILRNFISNALKFTERGSVRISAKVADDGESVVFAVADTGIGIALEDREMSRGIHAGPQRPAAAREGDRAGVATLPQAGLVAGR